MNISEFAKSRHVEPQTVSIYIRRHQQDFEGLTIKDGKDVILTDAAIQILDEVYPLPSPVQVVVDHESRDQLVKAQQMIIQLQQKLTDQAEMIAEAKLHRYLLDQKDEEIKRLKQEQADQEESIQEKDQLIQEREKALVDLQAELGQKEKELSNERQQIETMAASLRAEYAKREQMEQTGLFGRIFKKWNTTEEVAQNGK